MTAKEYRELECLPIDNNPKVYEWTYGRFMEAMENSDLSQDEKIERHVAFNTYLADNRERFKKIFGKPDFHYKSSFYFHCWSFEHAGETFVVLTADEKGTCIEMDVPSWEVIQTKTDQIVSFIQFLQKKIKDADMER